MAKLNQIIAVSKGVKSETLRSLTAAHRDVQKQPLLSGISRTYQPKDDEGERLPAESTRVQLTAQGVIRDVKASLTRLFDVVASQDYANRDATADIVVDGQALLTGVPVTYLLFLEKQLTDLHTFVEKLPTLDPSESWTFNEAAGYYATDPVQTTRTKKVPRNHVLAEATEKHPAQVQVYQEDVIVGTWATIKFSGALPATTVRDLLERVTKLREAVKFAREAANSIEVTDRHVGDPILTYLFG
ncbi:hypothetical protein GCM10023322_56690 [Rugosimonospora acidiphila]|uniref:Uncharacterized protein n=1 Tax=Rugosimonospora acidiphila TaxID=556531 RepID=A0ABP9SEH2_9ACTN